MHVGFVGEALDRGQEPTVEIVIGAADPQPARPEDRGGPGTASAPERLALTPEHDSVTGRSGASRHGEDLLTISFLRFRLRTRPSRGLAEGAAEPASGLRRDAHAPARALERDAHGLDERPVGSAEEVLHEAVPRALASIDELEARDGGSRQDLARERGGEPAHALEIVPPFPDDPLDDPARDYDVQRKVGPRCGEGFRGQTP